MKPGRSAFRRIVFLSVLTALILVPTPLAAAPLPPGGTFIDDDGDTHEGNIEAIVAEGITLGCATDPARYCPGDSVTRGQMASFLARALNLPATATNYFDDDNGSVHEPNINAIAEAGITLGCGPRAYCHNDPVTRAQMASFLARAFSLLPSVVNWFTDDDGDTHEPNINSVADAGITLGCAPTLYCPRDSVTRGQMASFLARALGLPPMVPPPRPDAVLEVAASGLFLPTFATAPDGDDRLFITELNGLIKIFENGSQTGIFLNIQDIVMGSGERGLLGMAFHPDYSANGLFYLNYINNSGDTEIAEFSVSGDPDVADEGSRRVLLNVDQPNSNHNGGMVEFGPDGYLYIALGDGGGQNCPEPCPARDPNELLGSILRIDVDSAVPYGVPGDNPFVSGGGAPEVYHYGLRNPWRFTFDEEAGLLYIADVGQGGGGSPNWEEVDVVSSSASGLNFGWDIVEGTQCHEPSVGCDTSGTVLPVVEYSDGCTIIGGYVYRGDALPQLEGQYFYADLCGGWIRSFRYEGGAVTDERDWSAELDFQGQAWSFGRDGLGELYVVTSSGNVYRIAPAF